MPIPLRLLVVEDSDSDDALPGRLLDHGEYDVHLERVDSAESMVTALDTAVWDLVIADLSPTGFNAAAALPLVTERGLDLPVIVVSDTVDQDEAMQMLRAGARDVLLKRDRARLLPAIERE
ncbi:MAG TPA: response regulator, partial [Chloroflexota bacterium]|nr:response regulator [Chloroflexota bacterium]